MDANDMRNLIRSIAEEVVSESLGNAVQQLETLFNESLEAYASTIVAGKIAGKLDDELTKAYERMVLQEADRIRGAQWSLYADRPDGEEDEGVADDPGEPSPFDEEASETPRPKQKKTTEGGNDDA